MMKFWSIFSILLVSVVPLIHSDINTGDGFGNVRMVQPKASVKEVKCLVCRAIVDEMIQARNKLDPKIKVEIGGYVLDAHGDLNTKTVPITKSQVKLSEMLDEVCQKFDDYVKVTWKHNNRLAIIPMTLSTGVMNPDISKVNFVQDGDLNKSLKYYCESIVEENEDAIIKHFVNDAENIEDAVCGREMQLCPEERPEQDFYSPTENDEL